MRDRQEIEREILEARASLEDSLGDLVQVVREKSQVRARATHAAEERARDAVATVRRRPGTLVAVAALALVGIFLLLRHRARTS